MNIKWDSKNLLRTTAINLIIIVFTKKKKKIEHKLILKRICITGLSNFKNPFYTYYSFKYNGAHLKIIFVFFFSYCLI